MKLNMPITDKEVVMQPGTILVTRTDLKGVITYANDAFVEISGFTREELIGKSHNIVRHPDMPEVAFADLWSNLKQGKPWTAAVKNRTKNGDYYWVEANVSPTFVDGQVVGYLSARYAPSREQITQASAFYKMLRETKATSMRPTGLSVKLKQLLDMSLVTKGSVTICAYLFPLLYLMSILFTTGNIIGLSAVVALTLVAILLNIMTLRSINVTLVRASAICRNLATKKFRNHIDLDSTDKTGDFWRNLYCMQVQLNADMAFTEEAAANTLRIKQALDNVTSSVMVANNNLEIIYMNNTVRQLFQNAEHDIRLQLPEFSASKLLGTNVDSFHKNPTHQRTVLANLHTTLSSKLVVGGRHLDIVANPVMTDTGDKIGVVVEWVDRTNEVKIEDEIEVLVNAVKSGDLSSRIHMEGKHGFFAKLSQGINDMTDIIDGSFSEVVNVMETLANGDLTQKVRNDYEGVYAECRIHINDMLDKLSLVVSNIRESAKIIDNTSKEIASGNMHLSQRAEEQAANLEETASSMEELTATVKNNAESAQKAHEVTSDVQILAEKGGDIVTLAVQAMQEINQSSNKIADMIGVIDEIAFQTNLLALNASVEAARAGENGRGFSVVATEVRNLAQRSAAAARQSKELIQDSVQKVRSGTQFVNDTGVALHDIVRGVQQVGNIISEIAKASAEQSSGIGQINIAIAQMDEITQQNAALAEEASAASVSMNEQSESMDRLMAFFTVNSETE